MASAATFPLSYPGDVRTAFTKDEGVRRIARVAGWQEGTRLLHLGCGVGWPSLFLAEQLGCKLVAADDDETSLDALRGLVKARSLADSIDIRKVDLNALPFGDGEFEGILVDHRLNWQVGPALQKLRGMLELSGRLALLYPVKVGRFPNAPAVEFWQAKIGEALRSPRELLQLIAGSGYEPQSVESLSDAELDEFYKAIEPAVSRVSDQPRAELLKKELQLHKAQAGKASVSFALAIARRKEPGERPPPSRSQG